MGRRANRDAAIVLAGAAVVAAAIGWFGMERPRRAELWACEVATALDQERAWRTYLAEFPAGACLERALDAMDRHAVCAKTRAEDTREGWTRYLGANPKGPCAVEARARGDALSECEAVREDGTAAAWRGYLARAPGGPALGGSHPLPSQ